MAAFPGGSPARDQDTRHQQMAERRKGKLIDHEFPSPKRPRSRDLEAILAQYIRAHPDEFFREQ